MIRPGLLLALALPLAAQYETVVLHGRVLDPETGLDAVRNIGITAGKIRAISQAPLTGRTSIEARGLVVAPGFIDLHAHGQDPENWRAQAMDGVTTALELEIGAADLDRWYAAREHRAAINFGASAGHAPVRMAVMRDPGAFLPSGDAAHRAASAEEITEIKRRVEQGLKQGAPAVGFGITYTPAATRWEILEVFRVAARFHAPCHVHLRGGGEDPVQVLEEVIAAAAVTGAPLHVVHLTSVGLAETPKLLQIIGEARARGMDVTTEFYPYTAAMTEIESAMFDPGWEKRLGIGYGDLQWTATGERLNAESFARYRKQGGMVVMHMIPPAALEAVLRSPLTLVASDGALRNGTGHPRGSGTFARVLGRYVRESGTLSLMDALRKMSLMPAQRLEARAPVFRDKGRIRLGADADLTIFDPARVADRATYERPAEYSTGIEYVLVGGTPVVSAGKLTGATPGRGLLAPREP